MSLMSFGQAEPEPLPEESAPGKRRRYLIIFGMVIALILAGGSAAYLILNSSLSANNGPPGAFTPPTGDSATATPGADGSASTSGSAALSASTSTSHGASPSADSTAKPPAGGGGGTAGPGGPATYRVASGELCPSVDFTAIHNRIGTGAPGSDHSDNPTSHYTDYICLGTFAGKVKVQIDAYVYASPADAAASYGGDRSAGGDAIGGVGSDAFGRVGGGGKAFSLYALDGNLKIKVYQENKDGTVPSATLRDVAISTATGTLPHLRA